MMNKEQAVFHSSLIIPHSSFVFHPVHPVNHRPASSLSGLGQIYASSDMLWRKTKVNGRGQRGRLRDDRRS
jgi:hypothetical protein